MKKFLLSAAMLIAAIGMSATGSYYVAGNGGADSTGKWCNGINWDAGASANAIIGGQIVFADVPAGSWEFKITDGTWKTSWGYDAVDIDASSKPLSNAGNVQFTLTSTQDITIQFDGTKIIVLGNLGSGDFDVDKDYSIMVRVYSTSWVDVPMTFVGNGVYEAKSVNLDALFKICDANYSPVNYGGDSSFVDPAEPYTLFRWTTRELRLEAPGIYDVTVTILADWSAELSLAPATAASYYVVGNGGADSTGKWCNGINWGAASANEIIGGQIVFADVPAGSWEFQITDETGKTRWGYDDVDIASSKPLSNSGGNVQFTLTSTQDITVKFDGTNIIVLGNGMFAAASYYVVGNGGADSTGKWCNGINWGAASANEIIGGQIVFADVPAGTWEFKVTDYSETWKTSWWGYGDVDIDASSKPLSNAGSNVQFTLTSTQDITIQFDGTKIIVLGNLGSGDFDVDKDYSIMVRVYSTPQVDNPMTFIGNGVYEAKSVNLDASFKIADANYCPVNLGVDPYSFSFVDPAEPYTLFKGSLVELRLEATGIYDVTVTILADWSAELSLAPATAVENVTAAAISSANGTIFADGEMQIFDLTGKNVTSQNGQLKGNYIVVVNGQSSKVNVQ